MSFNSPASSQLLDSVQNCFLSKGYIQHVDASPHVLTKPNEVTVLLSACQYEEEHWVLLSLPFIHIDEPSFEIQLECLLHGLHDIVLNYTDHVCCTLNEQSGDIELVFRLEQEDVLSPDFSVFVDELLVHMNTITDELNDLVEFSLHLSESAQ